MTSDDPILLLNATTPAAVSINAQKYGTSSTILIGLADIVAADSMNSNVTLSSSNSNECSSTSDDELHPTYFGVQLAVPVWEAVITTLILSIIIILTIVGNVLVILSVFTYKPLRIVQNFFIVSLAVADLTVALLVLPFNVAYSILGRWEFGIHLCKMWLTCDVMCCTSSILNLCAIALDRYWAITDPINYAQKRTVERVLLLIVGVWLLSLLISSPPLLGWNDWPDEFTSATPCELTSNRGYVIYSSLGSFFIPLIIMTIVYIEIYIATRRRLRERAQASKINTISLKPSDADAAESGYKTGKGKIVSLLCPNTACCGRDSATTNIQNDQESSSSETIDQHNEELQQRQQTDQRVIVVTQRKKPRRAKPKDSIKHGKLREQKHAKNNKELKAGHTKDAAETREDLSCSHDEKRKNSKDMMLDKEGVGNEEGDKTDSTIRCENDDENISLKITPPQSSAGGSCVQQTCVHEKPTGVYQFIEEKQKISLSKERRAARTLGIIMGVFVICWLPFFLMYVILPFCNSCCPTNKVKNFITWLGYINSGLNPVIYTIFNLDYRKAFKRLLGIK